MATYTQNLNLKKPDGTEDALIFDINNNMDLIDTAFRDKTMQNINVASLSALEDKIIEICSAMPDSSLCFGHARFSFSDPSKGIAGSPAVAIFTRRASGTYLANFIQSDAKITTDYYYSNEHHWGCTIPSDASAMGSRTGTTASLHNCTGTMTNGIYYHMSGNTMILEGRMVIDGYTRTGANPGFTVTIPNSKKLKRAFTANVGSVWSSNSNEGARANEMLNASGTGDSTSVTITTTETYANLGTATRVVFIVYPIAFEVY